MLWNSNFYPITWKTGNSHGQPLFFLVYIILLYTKKYLLLLSLLPSNLFSGITISLMVLVFIRTYVKQFWTYNPSQTNKNWVITCSIYYLLYLNAFYIHFSLLWRGFNNHKLHLDHLNHSGPVLHCINVSTVCTGCRAASTEYRQPLGT
jgi:hypothetical protein